MNSKRSKPSIGDLYGGSAPPPQFDYGDSSNQLGSAPRQVGPGFGGMQEPPAKKYAPGGFQDDLRLSSFGYGVQPSRDEVQKQVREEATAEPGAQRLMTKASDLLRSVAGKLARQVSVDQIAQLRGLINEAMQKQCDPQPILESYARILDPPLVVEILDSAMMEELKNYYNGNQPQRNVVTSVSNSNAPSAPVKSEHDYDFVHNPASEFQQKETVLASKRASGPLLSDDDCQNLRGSGARRSGSLLANETIPPGKAKPKFGIGLLASQPELMWPGGQSESSGMSGPPTRGPDSFASSFANRRPFDHPSDLADLPGLGPRGVGNSDMHSASLCDYGDAFTNFSFKSGPDMPNPRSFQDTRAGPRPAFIGRYDDPGTQQHGLRAPSIGDFAGPRGPMGGFSGGVSFSGSMGAAASAFSGPVRPGGGFSGSMGPAGNGTFSGAMVPSGGSGFSGLQGPRGNFAGDGGFYADTVREDVFSGRGRFFGIGPSVGGGRFPGSQQLGAQGGFSGPPRGGFSSGRGGRGGRSSAPGTRTSAPPSKASMGDSPSKELSIPMLLEQMRKGPVGSPKKIKGKGWPEWFRQTRAVIFDPAMATKHASEGFLDVLRAAEEGKDKISVSDELDLGLLREEFLNLPKDTNPFPFAALVARFCTKSSVDQIFTKEVLAVLKKAGSRLMVDFKEYTGVINGDLCPTKAAKAKELLHATS